MTAAASGGGGDDDDGEMHIKSNNDAGSHERAATENLMILESRS